MTLPTPAPTEPSQPGPAARVWTCLYCGTPCPPRGWRGCCSARCARLEHDTDYDPTED